MPCISAPKPSLPPLPGGVSFALPDLGPIDESANLCCTLPLVSTPGVPNPIPPFVLNAAVNQAFEAALAKIENYLDALPLVCPKE